MKKSRPIYALWALLTALCLGCGSDTAGDELINVALSELPCAELDGGLWESAPLPPATGTCIWLSFEGTTTYEIEHGLGTIPRVVLGYLAFEESGVSSTIGAGDSFLIRDGDEQMITLRNGSQQDFYLRLVLE